MGSSSGPYGSRDVEAEEDGERENAGSVEDEGALPLATPIPHTTTVDVGCSCPMCLLGYHIAYLFSNQRRASKHVMAARPSPYYAQSNGAMPPPQPPLERPAGVEVCPMYALYGFCPYLSGCYLPHKKQRRALVPRAGSADAELARLHDTAARHLDEEYWECAVCGFYGIGELHQGPVGEMFYYRQCPQCSLLCCFPYVTYLVEYVLQSVGDDYQRYKTEIDRYRALAPDEFKVPLSFEAHRVASTVFAWSLLSPRDAKAAVDAAYRALPEMEGIVSMGSGVGYIEHVFNRVMNKVDLAIAGVREADRNKYFSTSFDDVHASFYGQREIPIYAFDELALRGSYSVHVSLGGPLSLLSLDCRRMVLLLSWPPFGSPQEEQSSMGFETLEYFTQGGGEILIYVGDVASTGDWRFHQLVRSHYKLVRDYPVRRELRRWHPQEMGLVYAGNDTVGVYRRRQTPLPAPQMWTASG